MCALSSQMLILKLNALLDNQRHCEHRTRKSFVRGVNQFGTHFAHDPIRMMITAEAKDKPAIPMTKKCIGSPWLCIVICDYGWWTYTMHFS